MAAPTKVYQPTVSFRNSMPHRMPNNGLRKVTVSADDGPTSWIRRK